MRKKPSDALNHDTVQFVVDRHLCTSCGICAAVCPHASITMDINSYGIYVPVIDVDTCTECGICVRSCPGHEFNYTYYHNKIHHHLPEHTGLGPCLDCYVAYTNDDEILEKSQSGGLVTTVLAYCLEKGFIDGAVVSKWHDDDPLVPATYIARTRDEILRAVGSIYNSVPAAQSAAEILNTEGRFAFVGTSCQIQGMRKAEELYPKLSGKIVLYLGLHCMGVFTYHFHDQILHKIGLERDNVKRFRHRDKAWRGWPCNMRITDIEDNTYNIAAWNSIRAPRPFFTNWRCQLCFDKANEFSDISFGDCRIPAMHKVLRQDGYTLERGLSEFVVRTPRGARVVNSLIKDGKITSYPADADSLTRSIGVEKKIGIKTFFSLARLFNIGVPEYGALFSPAQHNNAVSGFLIDKWTKISSSRYWMFYYGAQYNLFRKILMYIPHSLFGLADRLLNINVDWKKYRSDTNVFLHEQNNSI